MSKTLNRPLLASFVLFLPLALGACDVGDPYARPETATPKGWQENADQTSWPSTGWWTAFGSDELNSYMQASLADNLDIAAAVARIREADATAKIDGASLLPTLDASLAPSRSQTPVTSKTSGGNTKPTLSNNITAKLSTSYEIDFWGKNAATSASALASAQASRFDRQTVGLTTQASLADTYFTILSLQERLTFAHSNLANGQEVLSAIQDKFRAGTATDLDVAQQENEVATLAAAIPPLEQSLGENKTALALLIGKLPEQIDPKGAGLTGIALPAVKGGLPSELLMRRPDVQYAEQNLIAANADITVARAALFPSVSLTGGLGYESNALNNLIQPTSLLWSLAGSVTQSIFHGGALEGEVEYKRARYDELVATYRKAVLSAFIDVDNALIAVRKTDQQEAAQRRAEETARRAYELSMDQLRGGVAEITTVLNTQRTLFSAQDTLVQARLSHLEAVVSLYKALGGGWEGQP
ncbi:MAG TPA: efflux transporter outer membrane subunit [Candidatus Sulfotelmatobacter sp.]|jgi:NodT family efflux transporter outer membrane factor (OMF) lipoprotein|nr:efflux transporter outer membrane subunit [Candidatus Sulfotelmatobacter sp.]